MSKDMETRWKAAARTTRGTARLDLVEVGVGADEAK